VHQRSEPPSTRPASKIAASPFSPPCRGPHPKKRLVGHAAATLAGPERTRRRNGPGGTDQRRLRRLLRAAPRASASTAALFRSLASIAVAVRIGLEDALVARGREFLTSSARTCPDPKPIHHTTVATQTAFARGRPGLTEPAPQSAGRFPPLCPPSMNALLGRIRATGAGCATAGALSSVG